MELSIGVSSNLALRSGLRLNPAGSARLKPQPECFVFGDCWAAGFSTRNALKLHVGNFGREDYARPNAQNGPSSAALKLLV